MKLHPWQTELMADPVLKVLRKEPIALLTAGTGAGKTLAGLHIARALNLMPFVVAPKVTLPAWRETAEAMGIEMVDAMNVEKMKGGKTKYLNRTGKRFTWQLSDTHALLIIDEAHMFCGDGTLNAHILAATHQLIASAGKVRPYRIPVLLMSATLGETPLKFEDAVGYLLGFHNRKNGRDWVLKHGCYINQWFKPEFPRGKSRIPYLEKLHKEIYPRFGVSLKHADIPGFPKNQIITELVSIKPKELKELQGAYDRYEELDKFEKTRDVLAGKDENALTIQLRARQMSEIAKIPSFVEQTRNLLAEGGSVVIFTSFRETMDILAQKFRAEHPAIVRGGQKAKAQEAHVVRFQAGKTRVCLVAIQAGGVGLSLPNLDPRSARYSIMSPPQSAVHYVQALGRIWRANSIGVSIQYLLIAQNTVEEKIAKNLETKTQNMEMIHDSDFWN